MKDSKQIYFLALALLVVGFNKPNAMAQSGPTQPEAMQFEPVDVTDVVNLATGDFVYTLPLMEVPGPEGGYPIVLSYHSKIGPNQPATWVGLGWTLNPGSINRTLSGYPDDYNGDLVETHYEDYEDLEWGISIGAGWGPVGLNMTYDHYSGMVGINAMVSFFPAELGGFGASASVGTNGASAGIGYRSKIGGDIYGNIGVTAGTQGVGISGGISKDLGNKYNNSLSLISTGVSLSSGGSANFRIAGTGFSSVTPANGEGTLSTSGFGITIPLPGTFWVSFGYQERSWKLNETYSEPSYGFLYQEQYLTANEDNKKYERQLQDEFLYASADVYSANAQGLSGTFTAYHTEPYRLFDEKENDQKANLTNTWESYNFSINTDKQFRFLDDPGGNVVANNSNIDWGRLYEEIKYHYNTLPRYASRQIKPIFNRSTNKLEGFIIISSDGKQYEFKQPVKNLYQYSETQTTDPDDDYKSYSTMATPYATSWLLTAVKGPDYVDRNGNKSVDEEDWGYWVKLSYESSLKPQVWRAPFYGFSPAPTGGKGKSFTLGLRETYHLNQVETASHVANFQRSNAKYESINLNVDQLYAISDDYIKNDNIDKIIFNGDYRWIEGFLDDIDPDTDLLKAHMLVEYYGQLYPLEADIKYRSLDFNIHNTYMEVAINNIENDAFYVIYQGKLDLKKITRKGTIRYDKLSNITLSNKKNTNHTVKKVNFNYDYSLRPNTPGSMATKSDGANKGTLTLKSVQFMGQNEAPVMPPYRFEYANGHAPGAGLNPSWHKDDWDRWGSYRDPGEDRGFYKHKTPQNKKRADKSAAWSLTKITNPTGSTVEVEYESDDYFHVNNTFDLDNAKQFGIKYPESITNVAKLNSGHRDNLDLPEGSIVHIIVQLQETRCRGHNNTHCETVIDDYYKDKTFIVENYNPATETVKLDKAFNLRDTSTGGQDVTYLGYYLVVPQTTFGGGSRVRRITTTDGFKRSTTTYSYKSGHYSSGVTTSLPAPYSYSKYRLRAASPSYLEAFMDHKYSYGRPAPGIIYSDVEVANVDENGEYINGKTIYEFYTSKDFPYSVYDGGSSLIIEDRSGIYGKPKAVTFYEEVSGEGSSSQFRPVKRNESLYAYSDELHEQGSVYIKGEKIDARKRLPGVTQQKYAFNNQISDHQTVERKVEHTYMNVYNVGSESTTYYYEDDRSLDPRDAVVTQSFPFGWDAYTGSAIHSAQSTSDPDEVIVNERIPAYWKYPGMEEKNMLTQNFQEKTYRTDRLDPDDRSSRTDFVPENDELVSSSVTTWSDHWYSSGIWRKNDTYVFDRTFPYREFPEAKLDEISHAYTRPDKGIPWKQTSNITEYDKYGHVLESVSQDGNYSTTLYGPAGRLVKGIATNTANDEVLFYNYEYTSSSTSEQAFTGKKSLRVSGTTTLANVPNNDPVSSEYYKARVWVLASGGNARIGSYTVSPRQGWRLIELKNLRPGQAITISGSAYVDDLVIMPEAAALSSYTYDPLTERLTSVMDANNSTTFFEYDDAGRLTAKRDQDKNLVRRFSYGYGGNHIKVSTKWPHINEGMTFSVETSGQPGEGKKFVWDFGTGELRTTTQPHVNYTFYETGSRIVSVTITDTENATTRVAERFYIDDEYSVVLYADSSPGYSLWTIKASVQGGAAPFSYAWLRQDPYTGHWSKLNSRNKDTMTYSAPPGGSLKVKCEVRDAEGRVTISSPITISGPD